ncbi:flagellin [Poriferisphaera sp. WC338]|uniref:flagellin N-terminal helical domain-containing protein n=1 Tax=Poriferisphaera sp. WC338 TaxID=3425129 RepID=UPI003D812B1F
MSRINTNVSSLISQRIYNNQNKSLSTSLERLSTGLRINGGGDDPAGLIASENLRSEKAAIGAAISNAERADQVVNVAEGGLQEINSLLTEVQSLVSQTANEAGLSAEEKEANQQQVDAILQTIDRISSTTTFQGTKLLNGKFDFQIESLDAKVQDYNINAAKIGDSALEVKAAITQSAQHAGVFLSLDTANLVLDDTPAEPFTIEIGGSLGARRFSFASGTAITDVAKQINNFKESLGVSADVSGTGISLKSTEYGSDQFVSVDVIDDAGQDGGVYTLDATNENEATGAGTDYDAVSSPIRDDGQDVGGTINGSKARGKGLVLDIKSDALDLNATLTAGGATAIGSIDLFKVSGGGAKFNLGPEIDANNQVRLGISDVSARKLGTTLDGTKKLSLSDLGGAGTLNLIDGDLGQAQDVVNSAIKDVSALRGRLGSFQKNVIGSTINSLGVALENVSAAESAIRDTDFASETAALTRSQILVQAASNVLAISKAQPQQALQLLG